MTSQIPDDAAPAPSEPSPSVISDAAPPRPAWAEANQLMRDYYDFEWGMPVTDDAGVYERIVLEGFQSGLSWETVLRKRPAFREAFAGFDPAKVAAFTDDDVERLLADPGIIRNGRKIRSAITNAQATVALQESGASLAEIVWAHAPADPCETTDVMPSRSPESEALSKDLKSRGFVFVGPVTMYALMQAIGIYQHRL